ncbi:MAG TPA: hypothetical protein VL995_12060 [Cellvibrio sp.]|nr:hypothetical protein [Cellvibrio sp.]
MAVKTIKKKLTVTGEKPLSNKAIKDAAIKSEKEIKNGERNKKGVYTEWQ